MRKNCTSGSVRGAPGNRRPYRGGIVNTPWVGGSVIIRTIKFSMANQEQIDILKLGRDSWNCWRQQNSDIRPDLSEIDLTQVLSGIDLRGVNFQRTSFYDSNLSGLTLTEADFSYSGLYLARLAESDCHQCKFERTYLDGIDLNSANLSEANLRKTVLSHAMLIGCDLRDANLEKADLSNANFGGTIFGNTNLSNAEGLHTCIHWGGSYVDLGTIAISTNLPENFLVGVGVPQELIAILREINIKLVKRLPSCFISYSSADSEIASRLVNELRERGMICWFAPHDLKIGEKIWDGIDSAIQSADRLMVILSRNSIDSDWVEDEVIKAHAEERKRKSMVLVPLRIDDYIFETMEPWAVRLRDARNIGDFSCWEDEFLFDKAVDRLLENIKGP
jgi:hypothetical protein